MTLKEALQQAIDSRSWFDIYAEVSPDGGCFMLDSEASFVEQECSSRLHPRERRALRIDGRADLG